MPTTFSIVLSLSVTTIQTLEHLSSPLVCCRLMAPYGWSQWDNPLFSLPLLEMKIGEKIVKKQRKIKLRWSF